MNCVVTLEISQEAARRAQDVAARTDRRLEDVLIEWIDRAVVEPPVETLPDGQVLALSGTVIALHLSSDPDALLVRSY